MDSLEQQLEGLQKAIVWSGGALVVGALIGFGLGVAFGQRVERQRERPPAPEGDPQP